MMSMGSQMGLGGLSSPIPGDSAGQTAMAFTYVPVPVYNLGGMGMPGMPMMPGRSSSFFIWLEMTLKQSCTQLTS